MFYCSSRNLFFKVKNITSFFLFALKPLTGKYKFWRYRQIMANANIYNESRCSLTHRNTDTQQFSLSRSKPASDDTTHPELCTSGTDATLFLHSIK